MWQTALVLMQTLAELQAYQDACINLASDQNSHPSSSAEPWSVQWMNWDSSKLSEGACIATHLQTLITWLASSCRHV